MKNSWNILVSHGAWFVCLLMEIVHLKRGCHLCSDWTGMLRRWDDSQRFLAEYHHLICEENGQLPDPVVLPSTSRASECIQAVLFLQYVLCAFMTYYWSWLSGSSTERGLNGAGGSSGSRHAVYSGNGPQHWARPTRLFPSVLSESQSKTRICRHHFQPLLCFSQWCFGQYITHLLLYMTYLAREVQQKSSRLFSKIVKLFSKIHYWSKVWNNEGLFIFEGMLCICLIKNTIKIVILWNTITI